MKSFLDAIDERVLVCDGAMGTMLYAKGVFINRCFDALNLTQPDVVSDVHQDYVRAGADVIETNTFGANRVKLRAFGLSDKIADINREGEHLAPELERRGAHVVGVNCSIGPAPMLETIDRLAQATHARLSAQPNAGKPRDIEGRNIYLSSPEYMASYARRFVARGVRLVGGCCGTTPEHIRQIKVAVKALAPSVARAAAASRPGPSEGAAVGS